MNVRTSVYKNNEEILRLRLENYRVGTYATLSACLIIAFGVLSNLEKINLFSLFIITAGFLAFFIGFFSYLIAMTRTSSKLESVIINKIKIKSVKGK